MTMTQDDQPNQERFKQIPPPELPVSFEAWREVIETNFPGLVFPAEVCASILAQILIQDVTNPFALVLIDVPSAGKTITINFFDGIDGITHATDKFTPSSFVSNAVNVKKSKLPEIDLLPRIRYKMLLVRDLAPLFGERDDDLMKSMGVLTRVLDGEGYQTESGIHGHREYRGDYLFMLLAGSTPLMPRVWKLMANLGSRLFFLNLNGRKKTEAELAAQLKDNAYKDRERLCRIQTERFIHTLWSQHPDGVEWDNSKDDEQILKTIARCARLLAMLRGAINVWAESGDDGTKYSHTSPTIELPDRINQQLYNLLRGHALVSGRKQLDQSDLRVAVEVCLDSCAPNRAKLLHAILEHEGHMTSSEVAEVLKVSKPTALKEMKTLAILGVCRIENEEDDGPGRPEAQIELVDDAWWFTSEECWALRGKKVPPRPRYDTPSDSVDKS